MVNAVARQKMFDSSGDTTDVELVVVVAFVTIRSVTRSRRSYFGVCVYVCVLVMQINDARFAGTNNTAVVFFLSFGK